ncbi:hypothetical protein AUJ66_02045 [Candidatus Desantisbacteria bacterium CG1_02_38_46]|uniref:Peptidase A2 domain-containing protein n=3 Tax=unclassified Candidatus Desantisiibacteriota TaxID=3106372 RepID=A0A2H9PBR3_9BACT|nr:MAG: hypothetical protein AUJ66_02045 [Candidatus Desantisbacteria bacterium CG1_02_38_46]PIU51181.1 MAG: hypothetical protein COS91_05745 [Candidatus Desantisbacteria bacterium CG07_land_8_20_14_0_80_39_15]PIZ16366.1 MAG: hypothetical protein COY51_02980 [Candidatus Desantisbacteria bacterium CG_4_10_14_0_8_um_filter_39_17]
MPSFITRSPHLITNGPIIAVRIVLDAYTRKSLEQASKPIPAPITFSALIDTGASITYISPRVSSQFNLVPRGVSQILTGGSPVLSNLYDIGIDIGVHFRRNIIFDPIRVAEAPLVGQTNIDCLLGRDILSMGVFIYIGYDGSFSFSI